MSLRDSLYHIIEAGENRYVLRFDAKHPILAGHFPGRPVIPGACIVQIAEELLSDMQGRHVCLTHIRNLKFRRPLTPDTDAEYIITRAREQGTWKITIQTPYSTYAEFQANYMCPDTDL